MNLIVLQEEWICICSAYSAENQQVLIGDYVMGEGAYMCVCLSGCWKLFLCQQNRHIRVKFHLSNTMIALTLILNKHDGRHHVNKRYICFSFKIVYPNFTSTGNRCRMAWNRHAIHFSRNATSAICNCIPPPVSSTKLSTKQSVQRIRKQNPPLLHSCLLTTNPQQ